MSQILLGIYIALLVVGGLVGFLKAGSKISLITSVIFAVVLAVCGFAGFAGGWIAAIVVQVLLLGVFVSRLTKTKKFMPSGLMVVVTLAAVVAELLVGH